MMKMLTLLNARTMFAAAAFFALPMVAKANTEKANPVTGATETYENTFTGEAAEWNDAANWDTSTTPFITTTYSPALVDGKTASTSTAIDGWTLRVGAYNGAAITWSGGITKIQAGSVGCWLTADETSSITIASFAGKQLEGSDAYPFKLSSANAGGITWSAGLTEASNTTLPFWYYLKDTGTVVYGGDITVANAQVIKQADVTLSGNTKSVQSKTLVSFGSGTTKTFTADAAIKVYGTDGTTLATTVNLATVNTTGTTTLTTDNAVGTCELVQTATSIVLYWVDGDPAAIVPKTYTPSISVNFCDGNNPLTTAADVGLGAYAVPGTSWNNMVSAGGNNGTFTTPLSTIYGIDSTGAQTLIPNASATISGTRGSWGCSSLAAGSDVRHGYADENDTYPTPTATISGIPYYQYRVIVYTATDAANTAFGYITVNGTDYTYENSALAEGTAAWGASGAANTAEALAEGVNVLVSPITAGSTATVVGHRMSGTRGCIAAVQIVEVPKTAGEGELVINVSGDTTYAVGADATYTTVYVTGVGTLSFSGEGTITTPTLNIGNGVTMPMDVNHLTPTAVTGSGTIIYNGTVPPTGLGWTDSANWQGTLWVKNTTFTGVVPNTMVNANSTLRLSGVIGYFNNSGSKQTCDGTLELENDAYTYALSVSDGYSTSGITVFAKLKGSGTLGVQSKDIAQRYVFKDASEFTGTINLATRPLRVILGDGETLSPDEGTITIVSGATATVASGVTWTANKNGFRVEGTLNVNGTIASSAETAAIKGSGTVVSTGKLPSVNGSTWWQNDGWTGTLWIKSYAISALNSNLYGNEGSTLKFTGVTGYFAQSHVNTVPIELEDSGSTVAFNYNNGWGGELLTFSELKGTGTLQTSSAGNGGTIWVKKFSDFAGSLTLGHKKVILGGSEPTHPNTNWGGQLVVAEGETATVASGKTWGISSSVTVDGAIAVNGFIWASGGVAVNGTFTAAGRGNWGGGTAMVINDTGVLELTSTSNVDESNSADYDYSNVTGTGTIKFNGTGYRGFPYTSPADTLSIVAEQANGLVFRQDGKVIGSLSGTKNLRSDLGDSGKTLTIKQAKDGVWSGIFKGGTDRLATIVVAPGDSTTGTLTLAGIQDQDSWADALTVSGSLNLTGTWKGDTTVSGTFGGTGTLTGNLTFSAGSTFKAFASDENGLSVSGSITYPASGTVTVDVSALRAPAVLLTAASESYIDLSKFKLTDGTTGYKLVKENATLKVVEAFSLVQRASGEAVEVEATGALLESLVKSGFSPAPTTTTDDVNDFLNAIDPNGLRRWENLVTGTATNQPPLGMVSAETASGNALTLSVNMVSDTNETAKVDFGYEVLRELRKGDGKTWTRVEGPVSDGTAFDIGLLDGEGKSTGTSGVYRVVTLLAYGSVTNEIPSTNAIGIVEVASTATNTITAVPWKRLASAPGEASDLTVSNFVAYANLSDGDAVYMLDGRAYKMWKKINGKWEAATTVSGDDTSISIVQNPGAPDVATIPCGGAVWVQRADATKPYFLVGQYDESAFSVTVPGSGAALIANPFPTNVTLNAINWGTSVTNDIIRIPGNGLHIDLSYKNGTWGYYNNVPVITDGVFTGAEEFVPYTDPIPAGTGFIYDRKDSERFTFEWK